MAVSVNFSLNNRANIVSSDQSVIFSFLKNNPGLNQALLDSSDTSTILVKSDRLVSKALASSGFGIKLTSSQSLKTQNSNPTTIQDDVVLKTNPADTQEFSRHGLTNYTVKSGDSVIAISSSFGISPQTIMMENKIDETSILKPGQELTILPTTGITSTLKQTDTLDSILQKYKISEDDFLDANNIESFEDLDVGTTLVIPLDNVTLPKKPTVSKFVKSDTGKVALKQASPPADFISGVISFIWPTSISGITQGFSRRHSGIDISDSKMEPIYASADGFVEISGYQNNGYGNTIVINHGNGFMTRYGHASELFVVAGEYVKQGQLIAKHGRTGRVRGATGIHLHFEVIKNGIKVNPLSYVKP